MHGRRGPRRRATGSPPSARSRSCAEAGARRRPGWAGCSRPGCSPGGAACWSGLLPDPREADELGSEPVTGRRARRPRDDRRPLGLGARRGLQRLHGRRDRGLRGRFADAQRGRRPRTRPGPRAEPGGGASALAECSAVFGADGRRASAPWTAAAWCTALPRPPTSAAAEHRRPAAGRAPARGRRRASTVNNGRVTRASLDKQPHEVAAMFDDVAAQVRPDQRRAVARPGPAVAQGGGPRGRRPARRSGCSTSPPARARPRCRSPAAGAYVVPCDFSLGMLRGGQAAAPAAAVHRRRRDPAAVRGRGRSTPSRSPSGCATSRTPRPRCARC